MASISTVNDVLEGTIKNASIILLYHFFPLSPSLTASVPHSPSFRTVLCLPHFPVDCWARYGLRLYPEAVAHIERDQGHDTSLALHASADPRRTTTALSADEIVTWIAQHGLDPRLCPPTLTTLSDINATSPPASASATYGPLCLQMIAPAARDICHPLRSVAGVTSSSTAAAAPANAGRNSANTSTSGSASPAALTQCWLGDGHSALEAVLWPGAAGAVPAWLRRLLPGALLSISALPVRAGVAFLCAETVRAVDGLPVDGTAETELARNAFSDTRRLTRAAEANAEVRALRAESSRQQQQSRKDGPPLFIGFGDGDSDDERVGSLTTARVSKRDIMPEHPFKPEFVGKQEIVIKPAPVASVLQGQPTRAMLSTATAAALTPAVLGPQNSTAYQRTAPAGGVAATTTPVQATVQATAEPVSAANTRVGTSAPTTRAVPPSAATVATARAPTHTAPAAPSAATSSAATDPVAARATVSTARAAESTATRHHRRGGPAAPQVINLDLAPLARAASGWLGHFSVLVTEVQVRRLTRTSLFVYPTLYLTMFYSLPLSRHAHVFFNHLLIHVLRSHMSSSTRRRKRFRAFTCSSLYLSRLPLSQRWPPVPPAPGAPPTPARLRARAQWRLGARATNTRLARALKRSRGMR